jgi:two-component system, sensor histidine kinase and response regulator
MKSKENKPVSELPLALTNALAHLENLADLLFVCRREGDMLYLKNSLSKPDYNLFRSSLNPILDSFLPETEEHKTTLKLTDSILELKLSPRKLKREIIITGVGFIRNQVTTDGLLWDSWFYRGENTFSPFIEKITGYTSEELNAFSGKGFYLLNKEESEKIKSLVSSFIVNHKSNHLELVYSITSKKGRPAWMKELIAVKRDSNGSIGSFKSSVAELTDFLEEKQKMEEMIINLQELNNAKDQFISVLSHDLKSPYTSILGFSEILLNETSLSKEERSEYLSYINLSSQNQLKLINNLLEWSRLVTGRKQVEKAKVSLKNIINEVISNNTRIIHKKNLELRISSDKHLLAEADERLMTETFNILISNAVKYSNNNQVIEIFLNRFREDQIEVIVKDEGVGITESNKKKLFKIDQLFTTPGTDGERGTGISLILANEIIKAHNGEMWFYSEKGTGSEFHFTLPAAGNYVLLVDEKGSELTKINNLLKSTYPEFRLYIETNYYDALKRLQEIIPCLVILSHSLPFMSGLEFVRTLKSKEKFCMLPVIVYSREITDKLKEEYKAVGVSDLFITPVNLKHLKERIERLVK